MQKDYWNVARRDFRALGFVITVIFLFVVLAFAGLGRNVSAYPAVMISVVILFIMAATYFYIAHLFKKRLAKAIPTAYSIVGVLLVVNLVNNIIAGTLLSIGMIVGLLIQIYLLQVVYKASKQKLI